MAGWRVCAGLLVLALAVGGCRDTGRTVPVVERVLPSPPPAPEQPQEEPPPPDPTPTPANPGVPAPLPGVYTDQGKAGRDELLRGLLALPLRDEAALEATLRAMYDPQSPQFRKYLSLEEFNARHAPTEADVKVVTDWLKSRGFEVDFVASNRLLIHFKGTVGEFNDGFQVEVRVLERKAPQEGNAPHLVYGLLQDITVPAYVKQRITALVALDLDEEDPEPPPPTATSPVGPPPNVQAGYTPQQVARAYGIDTLWARGHRGKGVRLGVVVGGTSHDKDVRAFWKTWGIERAAPVHVEPMGHPRLRIREANLDVQWAGAMAPEAELVVYSAPDARNTSMIYTFNEAVSSGRLDVITNSFAHREDSEPRAVRRVYSTSAMVAAALGVTVAAASGDSAGVDVPSSSPWVTAVGGTMLGLTDMKVVWETAWKSSGSGVSLTLEAPWWQKGLPGVDKKRAVVDVSLNAGMGYWYMFLGKWYSNIGTSFASPVFAGLVAVVNDARAVQGKPRLGFLNSLLYTRPDVQATFRDVTQGNTVDKTGAAKLHAGPGWDMPTGWGAPDADGLLRTLP